MDQNQKKIKSKTITEIKTDTKKEVCKGKAEIEIEADADKEAQQEKVSIAEQKEQNQRGFGDVFTLTIDFQCAGKKNDYEEELNFLETWLATPCINEVYTEIIDVNVEDIMHDEHVNEIFKYWSF